MSEIFIHTHYNLTRGFRSETMNESGTGYKYQNLSVAPSELLELIASVTRNGNDQFFMSNAQLAEFFGIKSVKTIRRIRQILLDEGWIEKTGEVINGIDVVKLSEKSLSYIGGVENYKV